VKLALLILLLHAAPMKQPEPATFVVPPCITHEVQENGTINERINQLTCEKKARDEMLQRLSNLHDCHVAIVVLKYEIRVWGTEEDMNDLRIVEEFCQ
jgi:hypothetical protein